MSNIHGIPSNGIVGVATTGVSGPGVVGLGNTANLFNSGYVTTTGTSTIYPYTQPVTNTQLTFPGILGTGGYFDSAPMAVPMGTDFMQLQGTMVIKGPNGAHQLMDILANCKHVKYISQNNNIVVSKVVWEALQTYIKSEDAYADLTPIEYLDKIFSPSPK